MDDVEILSNKSVNNYADVEVSSKRRLGWRVYYEFGKMGFGLFAVFTVLLMYGIAVAVYLFIDLWVAQWYEFVYIKISFN